MSIAIIGIGIPASGKTTVLTALAATLPAVYICPDDIRAEVSGGDPSDHRNEVTVWALVRIRALQALEGNKHVIIDATFTRASDREEFAQLLREGGATQVIAAYAEIPVAVAHERNRDRNRIVPEQVIERKYRELAEQPPSLEEGFDAIVPLARLDSFFMPSA